MSVRGRNDPLVRIMTTVDGTVNTSQDHSLRDVPTDRPVVFISIDDIMTISGLAERNKTEWKQELLVALAEDGLDENEPIEFVRNKSGSKYVFWNLQQGEPPTEESWVDSRRRGTSDAE